MTKEQILQKHFTAEFGHDGNGELAMQWWLSGKTMNEFFPNGFEKTEVGWQKK